MDIIINIMEKNYLYLNRNGKKNYIKIIIKAVDSVGVVRVGKTFIIPKKLDILPTPMLHARTTYDTYKVS